MKPRYIQIAVLVLSCFIIGNIVVAADNTSKKVVSSKVKVEANRILTEEVIPNISVTAEQEGELVTSQNESGEIVITTKRYIGLDSFLENEANNTIVFSGTDVTPNTPISIVFVDGEIKESTQADTIGNWSIEVKTDRLAAGSHQATVETINQGVRSNSEVIAEFEVSSEEALSYSTWIFLFSAVIAIVCLLLAITLQIRHNMKGFDAIYQT